MFEAHVVIAKTEALLGVTGRVQAKDGVVHVIADELWPLALSFTPEHGASRDFH